MIAVLPVVPGFVRAVATPGGTVADPNFFDRLYAYAWFVTFGLSFVAYLVLMRAHAVGPVQLTMEHEARSQSTVSV